MDSGMRTGPAGFQLGSLFSFTSGLAAHAFGYPNLGKIILQTTTTGFFYSINTNDETFRTRVFYNLSLLGFTASCSEILVKQFCRTAFKTDSASFTIFSSLLSWGSTLAVFNLLNPRLEQKDNQKKRISEGNFSLTALHAVKLCSQLLFVPSVSNVIDTLTEAIAIPYEFARSTLSRKPNAPDEINPFKSDLSRKRKWIKEKNQKSSFIARAASASLLLYSLPFFPQPLGRITFNTALHGILYTQKNSNNFSEEKFLQMITLAGLSEFAIEGLSRGISLGETNLMIGIKELFKPSVVEALEKVGKFAIAKNVYEIFKNVIYRVGATSISEMFLTQKIKKKSFYAACLQGLGDTFVQHFLILKQKKLWDKIVVWFVDTPYAKWHQFPRIYIDFRETRKVSFYPEAFKLSLSNLYNLMIRDVFNEVLVARIHKNPLNYLKKLSEDYKTYLFSRICLATAYSRGPLSEFRNSRNAVLENLTPVYEEYVGHLRLDPKKAQSTFGSVEGYNQQGNRLVDRIAERPLIAVALPAIVPPPMPTKIAGLIRDKDSSDD
ncbi:MAG: hypothetical protein CK425_07660 [Parachlamydia sp.]|nr:MAG: hypothetical protein CK425_07660 [Parachlamydia sp.]